MFKVLRKTPFFPWGAATIVVAASPTGRKWLRSILKPVVSTGLAIVNECKVIVEEAKKDAAAVRAEAAEKKLVRFEPPEHECKCITCHCLIPAKEEYCNRFCQEVEGPEDFHKCGCGHSHCDSTVQLGNDATLDRTTG
ncbi:MAG: hypothetical protein KGS72_13115 [Cyanobacteria bacterium REEB67]|nr:hypothetical protein [Cyanobacteria bacterium REEB67]